MKHLERPKKLNINRGETPLMEKIDVLIEKIDILIKINAATILADKTLTQKIEILSEVGLKPKEISEITGADNATVSAIKSRTKSRKKTVEEPKKEPEKKPEV